MLLVWEELLTPVAVFRRCVMTVAGMTGAPLGISATEIRAALEMLGIPRREWPSVSVDVSEMGRVAADGRNRRAQAK